MEKLDHRSRVTRMLIRRAFTDLLGQKPIESISVKELCAAAGINRGTFYGHYQDLYDLRRQMEEAQRANISPGSADRICRLLERLADAGKEESE